MTLEIHNGSNESRVFNIFTIESCAKEENG